MIRLRDKFTGAEAVWDRTNTPPYSWSGDPDLVHQLESMTRTYGVRPSPSLPPGDAQAAIAELFPSWGLVVVEQTPPVDPTPHFGIDGADPPGTWK